MIFTIFRDFSRFFRFYFRFKTFKIILKMTKSILFFARVPRRCDVALGATWQRHAGPRDAYATCVYIYIVYLFHIVSIMGIQPSVDRKAIQPIISSGLINPTYFTNLFRVGLKSHTVYLNAGDVA